jgi:ADP-ribosylglycohydrolase
MTTRDRNRFRGCLVGGAAGDALGYAVEFMALDQIKAKYGELGITNYELTDGVAQISDDTQMTLFTATGLLYGATRTAIRGIGGSPESYVERSYQDWLKTQSYEPIGCDKYPYSWLLEIPKLHHRRAPGNTCLSALRSGNPVEHSKGCGGVMRVAPVGLYFGLGGRDSDDRRLRVARIGDAVAAITHGHDLGRIPAAALAYIINSLLYYDYRGVDALRRVVLDATAAMDEMYADSTYVHDFTGLMNKTVLLSESGRPDEECIRALGEGWVAEETLAIAAYCALRHSNDLETAIVTAVNHDGDSDSTGSVCGNIMGAHLGYDAIPKKIY